MNKIYEKIYRKTHRRFLSKIMAFIYFVLINIRYQIGKICHVKVSIITPSQANESVMNVYSVPKKNENCYESYKVKDEVDLSIVVPAYNVEKYVKECIESIINQKTKYSFEVIIIDDGSTDDTLSLVYEFEDKRIKVISQENRGLSGARNTGMNNAKGRYIMFVDSDDRLPQDAVESLLVCADKYDSDIVQGAYSRFSGNGEYYQEFAQDFREDIKCTGDIVLFQGYAWGKLYKRGLWSSIGFPERFWFEDTVVKLVIYGLANKITLCDDLVYEYRANDMGISSSAKKNIKSLDAFFILKDIFEKIKEKKIELSSEEHFLDWFFKEQITGLLWNRINFFEDEMKESIFVLLSELVIENNIRYIGNDRITKRIYSSLISKKYEVWKNCAMYLSYQV